MGVREWLMRLVRSRGAAPLVRLAFAHLPNRAPGLLAQTDRVVAFRHPRPTHRVHILFVPRRPVPSLMPLGADDSSLLADVVAMAQTLIRENGLEATGYRLIVNGGPYQEVGQLHFHLVADGSPIQPDGAPAPT